MSNYIGSLLVELGINSAALVEGFDKATYKAKESARQIGNAFKGLGEDIGGILGRFGEMGGVIGEALSGAGSTIAKVAGEMGSLGGAAGAAAIGITALGAVAAAAAAGLSVMAVQGAELVHELSMISQKTGISITDLEGLKAAGSTVGVSLDAMVTGFRKFDQALMGTGKNTGAAQSVLRNLGVTALDNKEALNQVAEAFSKMEDGPRKAADAIALFGRSGLNLIPLLNKGAAGIAEFDQMVSEYGPKIGKEAVEANEAFLVSQAKLNLAWESAKVSAEETILPVMSKMITLMADVAKGAGNVAGSFSSNFWKSTGTVTKRLALQFTGMGNGRSVADDLAADDEERARTPEAKAAEAAAFQKEKNRILAEQQAQKEKEIALAIKDQGSAATALRLEKQKIADLEQAGLYKEAAKEYPKLPGLERQASLEKARNAYALNPQAPVIGPDKIAEMNAKLDEQLAKQRALADVTQLTTHEQILSAAAEEEGIKIADEARTLANDQKKAEQDFANLREQWGTKAYNDAKARLEQIKTERRELDASKDSMIQKAVAIAGIADDTKMSKHLQEEIDTLSADQQAWEITTAAIGKNTKAKIEAAVAAARLKEAAKPGSTEQSISLAGLKAGQSAEDAAFTGNKQKAIQMDVNATLQQTIQELDEIEAQEGRTIGTIYKRKEAIIAAQKEWDKEAMAVGDLNARVAAGLNELVIDGQDFWKKFEESGITAVQSLEGELAKLVMGSKTNFGSVIKSFGENFVKNGISSIVSKEASNILGNTGLSELIPGVSKKRDGSSEASSLWVSVAGGPLGGMAAAANPIAEAVKPASGGGLFGGGFGGILSGLLSFLPGLAGGGDVTPGKAYVVGEDHPEFFVPSTPGTIHPSLKMGGSTQNVTHVHFHGITDGDSFKRNESQIGQRVTNAVGRANSRR